jgi:thiamine pyrophosphate-dependent acetolactate synthase large subunit-like protein
VKRYPCLELLASHVDEEMITATCLTTTFNMWRALRKGGPNFYNLNLGLCLPFAVGLAAAFPGRKVIALDADGSLMIDASSLILAAHVNPANLVAIVFDNGNYARMGETATASGTDLEQMARGAGIKNTATLRTLEEFGAIVPEGLHSPGPSFFVAKVEPGERFKSPTPPPTARGMKDTFVQAITRLPDYQGVRYGTPLPGVTQGE